MKKYWKVTKQCKRNGFAYREEVLFVWSFWLLMNFWGGQGDLEVYLDMILKDLHPRDPPPPPPTDEMFTSCSGTKLYSCRVVRKEQWRELNVQTPMPRLLRQGTMLRLVCKAWSWTVSLLATSCVPLRVIGASQHYPPELNCSDSCS